MSGTVYSYSNIVDIHKVFKNTKFEKKYNAILVIGSDNKAKLSKQLVYFKNFVKRDLKRKKNNDNEPKRAGK